MKVEMEQQRRLLEIQGIDTEISRHRHGAAARELDLSMKDLTDQMGSLRRRLVAAETEASDLQREISRSEEDVRRVRARLERDRDLADQGMSAKVQRELQHELASLQRRLTDLEDAELELMQRQEDLERLVEELRASEPALAEKMAAVAAQQSAAADETKQRVDELQSQRESLVVGIDPQVMSRYDALRGDQPVAVAPLTGTQCGGCRLQLPPADLAELTSADADDMVSCPECGCLLVRD